MLGGCDRGVGMVVLNVMVVIGGRIFQNLKSCSQLGKRRGLKVMWARTTTSS